MLHWLKLVLSGRQIVYGDQHLERTRLIQFCTAICAPVLFVCCLLLYRHKVFALAFQMYQRKELTTEVVVSVVVMVMITIALLIGLCVGAWVGLEKLFPIPYMRRMHVQRLAQMIIDNQWFKHKNRTSKDLFNILGIDERDSREEIKEFPKLFYKMQGGTIYLTADVPAGKLMNTMLSLEKDVEAALHCELTDKTREFGICRYEFAFDLERFRIGIEDVVCQNGSIRLMEGVEWRFDELPHALIVGGTGGGKTYFILTLMEAFLKDGAVLHVLDPKNSDLADLKSCIPNVRSYKDEMIAEINRFHALMMKRTFDMKDHPDYKPGKNYRAFGFEPHFLIFDEYVGFMKNLKNQEAFKVQETLAMIAMLGRQMGFFIILACQRPDAQYFDSGTRDQFYLRVTLGKNSGVGYGMAFGSEQTKLFYNRPKVKGRGYIDCGKEVVTEFFTPLVPKGYDFWDSYRKIGLPPTKLEKVVKEESGYSSVDYWFEADTDLKKWRDYRPDQEDVQPDRADIIPDAGKIRSDPPSGRSINLSLSARDRVKSERKEQGDQESYFDQVMREQKEAERFEGVTSSTVSDRQSDQGRGMISKTIPAPGTAVLSGDVSDSLSIGQQLKAKREVCGLTQTEAGKALGLNRTQYGQMERGTKELPFSMAEVDVKFREFLLEKGREGDGAV